MPIEYIILVVVGDERGSTLKKISTSKITEVEKL